MQEGFHSRLCATHSKDGNDAQEALGTHPVRKEAEMGT